MEREVLQRGSFGTLGAPTIHPSAPDATGKEARRGKGGKGSYDFSDQYLKQQTPFMDEFQQDDGYEPVKRIASSKKTIAEQTFLTTVLHPNKFAAFAAGEGPPLGISSTTMAAFEGNRT